MGDDSHVRDATITAVDSAASPFSLEDLLARTSRTFAVAIPCLPFPTRKEVTTAYLLFRIADTIEDGENLSISEKVAAFDSFSRVLEERDSTTLGLNLPRAPLEDPHCISLLDQLELVLKSVESLKPAVRDAVIASTLATISGMRRFVVNSPDGHVRIGSVDELRDYCYVVAGIVGEMLTEVLIQGATWLTDARGLLDTNARAFGEGLQLVNILKDTDDDRKVGRLFTPACDMRPVLFELARDDLVRAETYVETLKQADAPPGFIAFTEIPVKLAWRTLECVEQFGPGSKVPRDEVLRIVRQVNAAAGNNSAGQ